MACLTCDSCKQGKLNGCVNESVCGKWDKITIEKAPPKPIPWEPVDFIRVGGQKYYQSMSI